MYSTQTGVLAVEGLIEKWEPTLFVKSKNEQNLDGNFQFVCVFV